MITLLVGTALALAALSFVLYPLLVGDQGREETLPARVDVIERAQAIDALREIEFDRATGKLSDSDYTALKASYTQRAVAAMRGLSGVTCPRCGPRPESAARYCSRCGAELL